MPSPLEAFKRQHAERWTVLQDIPAWEEASVMAWIDNVVRDRVGNLRTGIFRVIESEARILIYGDLNVSVSGWPQMRSSLRVLLAHDMANFLIFLDCLVLYIQEWSVEDEFGYVSYSVGSATRNSILGDLEMILSNGSKWKVAFSGDVGLTERIDEHLTQTAKNLNNTELTKAWNYAFGLKAEPTRAIEHAQKALEQIASTKGLTKAVTGVYGTLLGDIRANPTKYTSVAEAAYNLAYTIGRDPKAPANPNEVFANWFWMSMDLVQKTNPGRHQSEATKEFELDADAGKQAVLIITLLCQLIDAGYFKKVK